MRSTIDKDNKVFAKVAAELEANGFFDRWLGAKPPAQPIAASIASSLDADDDDYDPNEDPAYARVLKDKERSWAGYYSMSEYIESIPEREIYFEIQPGKRWAEIAAQFEGCLLSDVAKLWEARVNKIRAAKRAERIAKKKGGLSQSIKKVNDENCATCRFSKKVGEDSYNCYVGGVLRMSKKDITVPAKMCCMSYCHKYEPLS